MANTYWVSRRIQHLEGVNWIRNDKKLSSLQYAMPNFVTATYLFHVRLLNLTLNISIVIVVKSC